MTNLKGKLKLSQIIIILYFICHGSLLGSTVNALFILGHEDSWIVPIIGAIVGIIPFYLSITLMEKFPDKNIFEIIEYQFGKILGKIINILLILFICSYAIIFFWNLTNFISSQYLYSTPQGFIAILFIIPLIYMLSKGIQVILRSGIIVFIFSFSFFIISACALIPQIQISNIFPVLAKGISSPLKCVWISIAYLVLPTFMITCIPKNSYSSQKNFKKYLIISYFIIQLTIWLTIFCILSVFGIELSILYQYPEFQILRRVSIGGFIERVESTLSIHWILDLFMMITFACYFIKSGILHIFHFQKPFIKKYILNIILAIIIFTSVFIFSSNTSANVFLMKNYPIYCFIFLLGIPLITYIILLIKK